MTTIFQDGQSSVVRMRNRPPGEEYRMIPSAGAPMQLDFTALTDDALLAIVLDRAELADSKNETEASRKRVTGLKKLKSGNDGRGRGRPPKNA